MKRILFLLITVLCSAQLFAQPQEEGIGMLKVMMADNSPITVAVDGRYFRKHGTSITVGDLPEGRHSVKIYAYNEGQRMTENDLIYEGKVKTHAGSIVYFSFDPNNGPNITEGDMNDAGNGDNNTPPPAPQTSPEGNNTYDNNNSNNNTTSNNNTATPQDNAAVATPDDALTQDGLSKLKAVVDKRLTDTDKLKEMKQGLKTSTVSSIQVSGMMSWLNFESSRLEFAKWAYSITYDPENYSRLENSFSDQASRNEFESILK